MIETIPLLLALALAADSSAQQYVVQTLAGSDSPGDNSRGILVPLLQPEGVAVAPDGDVYIADAVDHRIIRMTSSGIVHTVAGTGRPGFSGDGGRATSAQLNRPYGIALDHAGNLYVADLGNARVRRIDNKGIITTVAGGGTVQLMSPRNVAEGPDGSLYISDFDGQLVYRLDTNETLTIVAGSGSKGFFGDDGDATLAQLAYPAGLATGPDGALYIADSGNARVRRIAKGIITTVAQAFQVVDVAFDAAGSLNIAAAGILGSPAAPLPGSDRYSARALAFTGSGSLVISTGTLVQAVDVSGLRTTIAGLSGPGAWGDGEPATSARFAVPAGCAIDATGNLCIADTGENRIREVTSNGIVSTVYGTGDVDVLNAPRAVALAVDGSLLIADSGNGRILKRSSSGVISTLLDKLNAPSYLFTDTNGDLYIAETGADRITVLGAGGGTKFLPVSQPAAVVRDGQGNLYVAQSGFGQLLRFNSTGWGAAVASGLGQPAGLTIDASGNVVVADSLNNKVVSISPSGTVSTLAGTGASGFVGDGGFGGDAQFSAPSDVKIDSAGRIFVVDAGNNRIRLLTPETPPAESNALRIVSAASFVAGPIAPDEIVSLFGIFDPSSLTVQVGGQPATLFYAGPGQINLLVPHAMSVGAAVAVTVFQSGVAAQAATIETATAAPALFTYAGGIGQAAALNQDNTVNSAGQPCTPGDVIVLYGTGFGPGAVTVHIGGRPAAVAFAGPAPDYPGLMQINAVLPADLTATGKVAVVVSIGSASSQPGVTITVN